MTILKRLFLVLAAILFVVSFVLLIKYYFLYQDNKTLVEKYSEPQSVHVESNFTEREIDLNQTVTEAQDASISKYRQGNREYSTRFNSTTSERVSSLAKNPINNVATTTSNNQESNLPFTINAPTNKAINGIAAGYVLTTKNEAQLREYFTLLNTLGVTWVRFDMDWGQIQRNGQDSYSWKEVDLVVKIAQEYNINTLAILGYAPDWAAKSGCGYYSQCAPSNPQYFADFASAAVTRYKGSVSAWEIWNEPNANQFWSPNANAIEYTELLKLSFAAIKKVDSNAIVVTGGLSPVTGSSNTIDPISFIKTMYAQGAKNSFDAISHHPYTYNLSPSSIKPWNHWFQMYKIYDVMNQYDDANKKIWITEFGVPTGGSGISHELSDIVPFMYGRDYMTEAAQAEMMLDLTNEVSKIKSWVGPVFWYSLIDLDSNSSDPEGHFGVVKSDNTAKDAYEILVR